MRIRRVALVLLCLLSAARAEAQFNVPNPAPAENFHLELGLMFWRPSPEIQLQTGGLASLGIAGVDVVREFALDKEQFMEFRAVLKAGRKNKIRVSYLPIEYNQDATLERTITFGGVTFPVSVPATANLKWDLWRFGYEFDFVAADRGLLGLVTELKHNHMTAALSAAGVGAEGSDVTAPILALGVIARVYPHRNVGITFEYTGFKIFGFIRGVANAVSDIDDLEAKMQDFDIYGTINFGRHVGAQIGYRSLTAEYLVDDDSGDLKLKGPYFGGVVRF